MYRTQVRPLLEENSNNINDLEICTNRVTGHITIKNDDEYVSKTKDIHMRINTMDERSKPILNDLNTIINVELPSAVSSSNLIKNKLISIENDIKLLEKTNTEIRTRITNAENKNESHYLRIDALNNVIEDDKHLDLFKASPIIIDFERKMEELVMISDYISEWNNDNNIALGKLRTRHTRNKNDMNKLPNFSEYVQFKNHIESEFSAIGATYSITGGS